MVVGRGASEKEAISEALLCSSLLPPLPSPAPTTRQENKSQNPKNYTSPSLPPSLNLLQILQHLLRATRARVAPALLQVQLRHHPILDQGRKPTQALPTKPLGFHGQPHELGKRAVPISEDGHLVARVQALGPGGGDEAVVAGRAIDGIDALVGREGRRGEEGGGEIDTFGEMGGREGQE